MAKIAVIVGSLRHESYSKKIAKNVAKLFPDKYEIEFISIGSLPLYNQALDEDNDVPDPWVTFREKLKKCDAVLFVTPEYNRSVPGVLKNAIDIGSRPMQESVWKGKPAAIISNSPSNLCGFGANHHLRQSLVFLDMQLVLQLEVYLANVTKILEDNGKFNNEDTVKFLQTFVDKFVDLINKHKN